MVRTNIVLCKQMNKDIYIYIYICVVCVCVFNVLGVGIWFLVVLTLFINLDFLVDIQVRLRQTKKVWSKRLDDFTRRVQESRTDGHNNNNAVPFRVLLQLFADQDVLDNGRLSAASFDLD